MVSPIIDNPLAYPGSLTAKLRIAAKVDFAVKPSFEGFILPSLQDCHLLNIAPRQMLWCRKVGLYVDNECWVWARTLIPRTSLQGRSRQLLFLQNKSLGSALFRDPHLQRSTFQFSQDGLTRSSLFHFFGNPLWVEERFSLKAKDYFYGTMPKF